MAEQYGQLPPDSDVWHFPARVGRVVDGDTLDMTFDLGMRVRANKQRVRLYGVDTAEVYGVSEGTEEYQKGKRHSSFVADWVAKREKPGFPLSCYTMKGEGKYGRWLVDIVDNQGNSLVSALFDKFGDEVSP